MCGSPWIPFTSSVDTVTDFTSRYITPKSSALAEAKNTATKRSGQRALQHLCWQFVERRASSAASTGETAALLYSRASLLHVRFAPPDAPPDHHAFPDSRETQSGVHWGRPTPRRPTAAL